MKPITCALLLAACGHHDVTPAGGKGGDTPESMVGLAQIPLSSPAFDANATIPTEYTCEGGDRSPPLAWSGVPPAAKSLALIVDDPDAPDPAAPKRTWVHWVLPHIPAATTKIEAGSTPDGAIVGNNDWGKAAWGGPCPPVGNHRYVFKLYALDAQVGRAGMTKAELAKAISGHLMGRGELVGMYQKKSK
jgi:Raf kinase inhibitor-like YbhB/YbcL family protein